MPSPPELDPLATIDVILLGLKPTTTEDVSLITSYYYSGSPPAVYTVFFYWSL